MDQTSNPRRRGRPLGTGRLQRLAREREQQLAAGYQRRGRPELDANLPTVQAADINQSVPRGRGGRPQGSLGRRNRSLFNVGEVQERMDVDLVNQPADLASQSQAGVPSGSGRQTRGRQPILQPERRRTRQAVSPQFSTLRAQHATYDDSRYELEFKQHLQNIREQVCSVCNRKGFDLDVQTHLQVCFDCAKCQTTGKVALSI